MEKYVSLEKFLNVSQVSENTIRKRYKDIPGIKYENGKFEILEGTRFPFNIRHNALKTDENRLLVLLKAIDQRKYIDASILRVYQSDFEELLWTLLMGRLIKPPTARPIVMVPMHIALRKRALNIEKRKEENGLSGPQQ